MKNLRALISPLAALAFSTIAQAAPVQYQLTAIAPQHTWDGFIYGPGDTLTATFWYDASLTPDQTYTTAAESWAQYSNPITNFHAEINGYTIDAADFTHTSITSISGGDGQTSSMAIGFNGVTPHTIINGNIYTVMFFSVNYLSGNFPDAALPTNLTIGESGNGPTLFLMIDSPDPQVGMVYGSEFTITSITAVPLPSAALFFLSGLIGLGANAARKLKR